MENGSLSTDKPLSRLYRRIEVYEKADNGDTAVYVCFEILGRNAFVVQSKDFIAGEADEISDLLKQSHELFRDCRPDERMSPKPSLQEAIEDFNSSFD